MNKSEIVGRVAGRMGLSKPAAEGAVDTVLSAIGEALAKGEDVRIAGFGTFATRTRRARRGRNPRTGESVSIPASKTPSFKAGKALKETVNRGWESTSGERGDGERPRRERMVVQSVARDAVRARGSRQRGPGEAGVRLDLSDWPGGVAPVWAMLDPESAQALRDEPSEENRALRLASDLTEEEFGQSAFVRNALVLLEGMAVVRWLWLTDKGNFQRATVAAMRASMFWPGMEATEQFRADKALREEDVGELHLLHRLAHMAGLVEGDAAMLRLTSLGRDMLEAGRRSGLQALLFRHAFWHMDLSRFVSGLPRGLPGRWPQGDDVGQLLWCLSAVGLPKIGPFGPFIGAGVGVVRTRIGQTRMTFPRTTTIVPGASRVDLAWMLTAGVAVALGERATLDLAWRYSDLGEVRTGRGEGRVVWRDGSREPRPLDLAATRANLASHGLLLSVRYAF